MCLGYGNNKQTINEEIWMKKIISKEESKAIKKKERVFDFFWSLEEQQTILGLLKGRKMKKELKKHLKDKEVKNV